MSYKVVYIALAKDDFKKAVSYYKAISSKLANDFIARVGEAEKYLSMNPYGNDIMYKEVRMHNLHQFPYHMHYKILEDQKQIIVLAIAFSKRNNLDFSNR